MQTKLTINEAVALAKRFPNKTIFQKEARTAYRLLSQHPEMYKSATSHMKNPLEKWHKEAVIAEARKYTMPWHFQLKAKGAYWVAQQKGWLTEACSHMDGIATWDIESATLEAKKYSLRKTFMKESRGAYNYLLRISKAELHKACSHMEKRFLWTKETALAECKKYTTRKELRQNNDGCYAYVFKAKIEKEAFAHMKSIIDNAEKRDQGEFETILRNFLVKHKIKFVMLKEFKVSDKSTHRVDIILNLITSNLKMAIEYKADSSYWKFTEIEKQRKFYQKHLSKMKVKETYLVSKKGKYGWSEELFFSELKKMIKSKKIVKYKLNPKTV